jgi:hypothetical protein
MTVLIKALLLPKRLPLRPRRSLPGAGEANPGLPLGPMQLRHEACLEGVGIPAAVIAGRPGRLQVSSWPPEAPHEQPCFDRLNTRVQETAYRGA